MPLLVVDSEQVGHRVQLLRKYAAGLSGRALGQLLGSSDPALVTRLEQGRGLTHARMVQISNVLAGQGMLKATTPEEILAFLEGRLDQLNVVLDGQFHQMS